MQFVDTNVCLGARRFQRPSHDCTAELGSLHGLLAAPANPWPDTLFEVKKASAANCAV
jgi:hypothetical protein